MNIYFTGLSPDLRQAWDLWCGRILYLLNSEIWENNFGESSSEWANLFLDNFDLNSRLKVIVRSSKDSRTIVPLYSTSNKRSVSTFRWSGPTLGILVGFYEMNMLNFEMKIQWTRVLLRIESKFSFSRFYAKMHFIRISIVTPKTIFFDGTYVFKVLRINTF